MLHLKGSKFDCRVFSGQFVPYVLSWADDDVGGEVDWCKCANGDCKPSSEYISVSLENFCLTLNEQLRKYEYDDNQACEKAAGNGLVIGMQRWIQMLVDFLPTLTSTSDHRRVITQILCGMRAVPSQKTYAERDDNMMKRWFDRTGVTTRLHAKATWSQWELLIRMSARNMKAFTVYALPVLQSCQKHLDSLWDQ